MTHPISWENAKDLVHTKLWEDELSYDRWLDLRRTTLEHWDWEWDGSCDLKDCETWSAVIKTLAKHIDKQWDVSWDDDWEYPLD